MIRRIINIIRARRMKKEFERSIEAIVSTNLFVKERLLEIEQAKQFEEVQNEYY